MDKWNASPHVLPEPDDSRNNRAVHVAVIETVWHGDRLYQETLEALVRHEPDSGIWGPRAAEWRAHPA